jgi:uracil-DNA glycosylase family 4
MSSTGEEADPIHEARALLASGHALVKELIEEGVSEFPRMEQPAEVLATSLADRGSAARQPARAREESIEIGQVDQTVPWSGDRRPDLEEVRSVLGDCTRCDLCRGRSSIVFGDGNPDADLMFVGEGPGEQEDLRGLPFVGRAGELLTQMIEKGLGIPRSEVYICNIVKCRPPQNRNPLPPEVSACRPFLDGQIRAVAPKVIVTLGKPAASLLLDREVAITRLRGTWHEYQDIPLMPTLHPAYVLRQYTTENRRAVWQDLQAAFERTRA